MAFGKATMISEVCGGEGFVSLIMILYECICMMS